MTTLATTTTTRPQVGKRTELGRYTLPNGTTRQLIVSLAQQVARSSITRLLRRDHTLRETCSKQGSGSASEWLRPQLRQV